VAEKPEANIQLARLLGEPGRSFAPAEASVLIEQRLALIAEGLIGEAAASDDVTDRASARAFLEDRLEFLSPLLTGQQLARLRAAVEKKIEAW
jgi:hypothetical protein